MRSAGSRGGRPPPGRGGGAPRDVRLLAHHQRDQRPRHARLSRDIFHRRRAAWSGIRRRGHGYVTADITWSATIFNWLARSNRSGRRPEAQNPLLPRSGGLVAQRDLERSGSRLVRSNEEKRLRENVSERRGGGGVDAGSADSAAREPGWGPIVDAPDRRGSMSSAPRLALRLSCCEQDTAITGRADGAAGDARCADEHRILHNSARKTQEVN